MDKMMNKAPMNNSRMRFVWLSLIFTSCIAFNASAQLTIQEEGAGFCSTDGVVDASSSGPGFLDYVSFAKWSIDVETAGTYTLTWRYALGGGNMDSRNGQVYLNDTELVDTVLFPHTGGWASYAEASIKLDLSAGVNEFRVKAFVTPYLPHIDYFEIAEAGVSAGDCITRYSLTVGINDENAGMVSYEPVQDFYVEGTEITLTATPNAGYFFQSWEGNDADTAKVYKLKIKKNTVLEGRFLPNGTRQVPNVYGYATVQNDKGTPYLLTGGSLGDTVAVTTVEELQQYLAGDEPKVVTLDRLVFGTSGTFIKIGSNKTLVGITDEAEIQGMRTQLQASKNVIIKKIKFSKTITFDALQINSNSEQIWIDSCEFYSDRDHHKDYYDGLLDIKNSSSFITVSHSRFHDHAKSILISSGDQEVQDSVIRITFHHNYFHHNGSRLPSLRFGKAHIFNNYYTDNGGGVNTRVGACIRVEKNLFENNGGGMLGSTGEAYYQAIDNIGAEPASNIGSCVLNIPYEYQTILEDDPTKLKELWKEDEMDPEDTTDVLFIEFEKKLSIYPNPARDRISIRWKSEVVSKVQLTFINMAGVEVLRTEIDQQASITTDHLPRGVYLMRFTSENNMLVQRPLILN